MTAAGSTLTGRERSALGELARSIERPRMAAAGRGLRRAWTAARTNVLSLAGFACLDVAAFEAHPVAGWAATGLSLLVLEYLGKDRGPRA